MLLQSYNVNIGIKHDYLCINVCWAPREVVLQHLRGAQQMLMYQESMFDIYFIKHFFARKLRRNCFKKFFLPVPIMAWKSMLPANITPLSRAKTNVITAVHFTDDDVSFYNGPGMVTSKTAKQSINSTWIALLIHGFVLVKTWLLIACNTAFYAIIIVKHGIWQLSFKDTKMPEISWNSIENMETVCNLSIQDKTLQMHKQKLKQ